MTSAHIISARARTDADDRLIEAEEPLASFHLRSGGELPGPIVTPALLDLVRKARKTGKRMSRAIRAQDSLEQISAWAEVVPGKAGTIITISTWEAEDVVQTTGAEERAGHLALVRHLSGLTARLDTKQNLLTVDWTARDMDELGEAMMAGVGQPWTDFAGPEGSNHRQPLHWRLLDGALVQVAGSSREWAAQLVPLGHAEPGSEGFELYLVPDRPLEEAPAKESRRPDRSAGIGREIAPVLRQPVSRIIANAETIRTQLAGPLADEYSNYAADIASAGEHLLALIDDLTTLEMVEDEDFAPAPDNIDLADVARRAAGILGVRAKERGIVLDAPKDGESVPAIGEFRRTLQVLLNLVGNAIRYSPEGGQVWIRVEEVDGRARAIVADQGEGLDEDQQAKVFAKFERLGRQGDGGSGLGLYISRRLARAMNGDLTVESAKGQGARFTLEIPADPDT
ncbi:sensor histidine kinase [Aurantiacibacter sp. D1-12]|uniref:sensor histidine kinase n=1 Tax=Aurantiacibacter sp. D1-12 TaxID=2993658 RepID=UPI00237C95E9|nr:HAMP domain-containing sensor histidine kinase [Aurantiacibacter sp. D1-12]MDE1466638.1 HAMP domain-containing sensor histidine kinase [Aurantiacibacter sp. D1-12]